MKDKPDDVSPSVKLNSTFLRLSSGESTISKVIAKREEIRAAMRAKEGSAVIRRREVSEYGDPFASNFLQ